MSFVNGEPATPEQLRTLALINYGHFTSMRVDDGRIRGLSHHLDRLASDCSALFAVDLDRERVRSLVRQAADASPIASYVVRVTIFDPELDLGHPARSGTPCVLVTTRPAAPLPLPPLTVRSVNHTRELPAVKHVGLLSAVWSRRQAQLSGFDDALFVDRSAFISEGATWNIGFFDGDRTVWPNADILPGVTMRLLKQVHDKTVTMPVNLRDVPQMQAAFATNTTVGVRPIARIDNLQLAFDHEILTLLRKEYEEIPAESI